MSRLKRFIPVLTLFIATACLGQNAMKKSHSLSINRGLWFGLKANGNYAHLRSSDFTYQSIIKPGLGLFAAYDIARFLRPQVEVEMSSIGIQKSTTDRTNKNYFDMSLLLNLVPGRSNVLLTAGVSLSTNSGIYQKTLNGTSPGGLSSTFDKSEYGRQDFFLVTGLAIPLSRKLDLYTRYYYTTTSKETSTSLRGKPSFLQISVALNLNRFLDEQEKRTELNKDEEDNRTLMEGGVMLVRLNYPRNLINWYRSHNNPQGADSSFYMNGIITEPANQDDLLKADSTITAWDSINAHIMRVFKEEFTFCKVYFFKDEHSEKVANHNFDSVFLNDQLQIDTSLHPLITRFLVAEFGFVQLVNGLNVEEELVVLNSGFRQMKSPFPYSRFNMNIFESRKKLSGLNDLRARVLTEVPLLNRRIEKFYRERYDYGPQKL